SARKLSRASTASSSRTGRAIRSARSWRNGTRSFCSAHHAGVRRATRSLYRHIVKVGQIEFFVADLTGAHTRVPLAVRPYLADWTSDGAGIVYLSQGAA